MRNLSIVLLPLIPVAAGPTDYEPVRCTSRQPYAGRPLHSPIVAGPTAPVPETPVDPVTAARLDAALEVIRSKTNAPALTAAVGIEGKGMWTAGDGPPLYWASAGKTFTAVVVLQLVQEGKLSLDDPVSRWIDGVPNGDVVTIRDLMAHTAGLFSANEDAKALADPRYRDPKETLAIARRHGAMFCPGANWRYSNTGYDLLGEIVRRADRRPIDQAITDRIIAPLRLGSVRALAPGGGSAGVAPLTTSKGKPMDPSWAGAAGPVVGNAGDMIRFWSALLNGRLLPKPLVAQMTATLYPMFDANMFYGLGAMAFDLDSGDRHIQWVGHAGGTPGANALVAYSPAEKMFVAVALTGDGSAAASANLLMSESRPELK